jgi:hypothetical protein
VSLWAYGILTSCGVFIEFGIDCEIEARAFAATLTNGCVRRIV